MFSMTKSRELEEVHFRGVNVNKRHYGRNVKFYHSFLQHTEYTFFLYFSSSILLSTLIIFIYCFFQESLTGHYLASLGSATTFYQALFHLCVRQYMQSYSHLRRLHVMSRRLGKMHDLSKI